MKGGIFFLSESQFWFTWVFIFLLWSQVVFLIADPLPPPARECLSWVSPHFFVQCNSPRAQSWKLSCPLLVCSCTVFLEFLSYHHPLAPFWCSCSRPCPSVHLWYSCLNLISLPFPLPFPFLPFVFLSFTCGSWGWIQPIEHDHWAILRPAGTF